MIKKRLLQLLASSKKYIYYQVAGQWVALLCQIAVIYTVANLLRAALEGSIGTAMVVPSVIVLAVALLVRFFADRFATRNSYKASVDVKRTVREKIYGKLLRLGASYREHISTSEVVQLSVEGAEQLETYFGRYLSQLIYSLLAPLTLFVFLFPYNWQASLVLLVCVPLIPMVIMAVQKIASRLLGQYLDIYNNLGDTFLENLQGLTTLKIYRADAMKADALDAESERFRVITMKVLRMQLNSIIVMDIIAYSGAAAGMIVALWQFSLGAVDFAGALMIILLASEFFIPMRMLGSFFHIAMNGMAASDKMFAFLDLPDPEPGAQHLSGKPAAIKLSDVRFSYTDDREVLKGVGMDLPAGSFTSLVGTSGCGKSTVSNVLMGRNKGYTGHVSVEGHELSDVDEGSLMRQITMVSNNSYLFRGTVRDNLLLGNPDATDEQMHAVLRQVNLEDYLVGQHGLDTELAEEAGNLSGGQRQRLAIARALLHDSPMYIFDEATSNIDMESEAVIMDVVHSLAKTKTVVLISHRLANVVDSDCIYLMRDGTVAERGTHDQLMRQDGAYAKLFNRQRALENYGKEVA